MNEAATIGARAPVIRESDGGRSAVTGGTLAVSDWLVVRIASGSAFLDRTIALVEGAARQKTPDGIALHILLAGLTIVFLIAAAALVGLASWKGRPPSVSVLAALLVTLIPTSIGGLLSVTGMAGMARLVRFNVPAASGRAVEAAGDGEQTVSASKASPPGLLHRLFLGEGSWRGFARLLHGRWAIRDRTGAGRPRGQDFT